MSSVALYSIIVIYTVLTGLYLSSAQMKYIGLDRLDRIKNKLLMVSLPLLFVLVANDSCTDFSSYVKIFNKSSFSILSTTDQEVGWIVLNSLVKLITQDGVIGVNIIRGLTYALFVLAIIRSKEYVDVGWAWIAFVCICYFNILSAVAFMLAVAFVLLGYVDLVKKKYFRMAIELILAVSFHYTAIIPLAAAILYFICYSRQYTRKVFVGLSVIGTLLIAVSAKYVFMIIINAIPAFSKYAKYGIYSASGTGLRQFLNYLPIFACLFYAARGCRNRIMNISFIVALVGFAVGISSYSINNLLRTYLYFSFLFIICLPTLVLNQETYKWQGNLFEKEKTGGAQIWIVPFTSGSFKFLVLVYLLYRVFYLLSSEWATLYSSGFSEFHFLF